MTERSLIDLIKSYGQAKYDQGGALHSGASEAVVLSYANTAQDLLDEIGRQHADEARRTPSVEPVVFAWALEDLTKLRAALDARMPYNDEVGPLLDRIEAALGAAR
ncbi:hypothetical protein [Dactylosporangium sp. CA-139066]|uniref:hypothetical protein n=1 Tax=Dactylosporangium sp. CA-139066 TaxID=3239930 RepID=UPI003D8CDFBA